MTERPRPPSPYDFLPPVPQFTVDSNDLTDGEWLPDAQVHAQGNTSPHLRWSGFPQETRGFAVTCYDPDAPTGSGFWHWVLLDIPANVTELPTGAGTGSMAGLPSGTTHALNDFVENNFGGAAPPAGDPPHRYMFAVHALDVDKLGLDPHTTPGKAGFNITAHTIARALLTANYGE